jgi:hypothetical protein
MSTPAGPSAGNPAATPSTPPAAPPRKITPIPDRGERGSDGRFQPHDPASRAAGERVAAQGKEETIPGVMSDNGIAAVDKYLGRLSGEEPAEKKPKPAEKTEPKPAAPAGEQAEAPEPEAAKPAEAQEEGAEAEPETPPEKYRLRNASGKALEWDSEQAAFDNISALRGMHKSLQDQVKQYKEVASSNYTYATQTQARIQELERQLASRPAEVTQAGQSQPVQSANLGAAPSEAERLDPSKGILEQSVDWNLYKTFKETHGPEAALIWATEVALQRALASVRGELQQSVSPYAESLERANITQEAQQLFRSVASYESAGGGLVYPEMHDPAALPEIMSVWLQTPIDTQAKMTPFGVHLAVLAWRDWRRSQGKPWQANQAGNGNGAAGAGQQPTGQPPSQVLDPLAAAREIVESVIAANAEEQESPVGSGSGHRPNSPRANREQRLKQRLRKVSLADNELGFGR